MATTLTDYIGSTGRIAAQKNDLAVIEWSTQFELVQLREDGTVKFSHFMGDGVDQMFNEAGDEALSPGTPEWDAAAQSWLSDPDIKDAYFEGYEEEIE